MFYLNWVLPSKPLKTKPKRRKQQKKPVKNKTFSTIKKNKDIYSSKISKLLRPRPRCPVCEGKMKWVTTGPYGPFLGCKSFLVDHCHGWRPARDAYQQVADAASEPGGALGS